MKRVTIDALQTMKGTGELITVLTAYDFPTARLLDEAGIDVLLVGDSVGNVVLGYENTLPVTMEVMLHHTAAVARGVSRSLVVADMPFMSYQVDASEALRNAGRLVQEARAQAVKLEGGEPVLKAIHRVVEAGIPVMGHLGYTPQSVNQLGSRVVQGRTRKEALALVESAQQLEEAGCFSIVLECVPAQLAAQITESVGIPTIGIGAGAQCDGQVLVLHDILGMTGDFKPKFVKRYADIGNAVRQAVEDYAREVRSGAFPNGMHSFALPEEVAADLARKEELPRIRRV
ncbi:MAG: 3-methyl-2-oxobutanoate hydroxymethyltransferase [Armatimonadetes bacterium CG2_30_59_28]|nr:3-methyl-2-oxobutanoate hydroxymethyltransferase [Armatimonadota bacterium]OIO96853.1 MAG: 3-methyl-2-oxobutanoate hydroxymethyltransferase [Armatimonadetes bacterium CG2_30_59_28]PIU60563.1 MAG: 3-methyl-2-oxobutanoate hydroxymethyltransferase [Armatimonadetes bacterium CG07_land_8_20_14_0_80_59_28]PIX44717.1 MAG: 3-methyl-2-oxobutanoate hydroxymethyltransferase [Armatimonadetes bacterium CG_4_8_14_3_um_filter_58_9]PIY48137.1 MAG: 3-methyl-2-oxobutanoate hydroxymethyltransferase [Armatimona